MFLIHHQTDNCLHFEVPPFGGSSSKLTVEGIRSEVIPRMLWLKVSTSNLLRSAYTCYGQVAKWTILYVVHLASLSRRIWRGGKSRWMSVTADGMVLKTPEIARQACFCKLESFALCCAVGCKALSHQATAPYVIIGLTLASSRSPADHSLGNKGVQVYNVVQN